MSVEITPAAIDAVKSVLAKHPKDVQDKVIEATNQLLTISARITKGSTSKQVQSAMDELYCALPEEVQQGVYYVLEALLHNVKEHSNNGAE